MIFGAERSFQELGLVGPDGGAWSPDSLAALDESIRARAGVRRALIRVLDTMQSQQASDFAITHFPWHVGDPRVRRAAGMFPCLDEQQQRCVVNLALSRQGRKLRAVSRVA